MANLWMIERAMPGWSDEDLDAAGIRAKICVLWYPNMTWIRTLYDRAGERTLCIYRAETEEDIRAHAVAAGLPCGTVLPIDEVLPSDFDEPTEESTSEQEIDMGRPPLRMLDPA